MKATRPAGYIHGTEGSEQERLALLNHLTNRAFISFLEHGAGEMRVLEVGSGLGILAAEVAGHVTGGAVYGLEYAGSQLRQAQQRAGAAENLRFIQGDAHRLPFAARSFDKVYCRYLLEHTAEPARVLSEMHRVLKTGGRAYAQENNILVIVFDPECPKFETVWRGFAALQRELGGDALIGKRLYAYFKRAGFEQIELSIQPEVHYPDAESFRPWIENLIGNVEGGAEQLEKHGLATSNEVRQAITELRAFAERDDASTVFYWNRATGVKSSEN